ncbi:85/88 kDa calcium-independent phospholipase A2 isoform X1 [Lates japonicus]|uniref:85/88 kDa calcium-independent phospholipase A2 isoform X1 n=1 Tax=Lates japonicus TaxID=270547 RepID=A0AAD3RLT2_LATJO|nr:85/88 kDa calcium-independent phospholipase A2 isoform X1 [Lates japonicus]
MWARFPQYALKLRPFYGTLPHKAETTCVVDCIRNHPDWSSTCVARGAGLRVSQNNLSEVLQANPQVVVSSGCVPPSNPELARAFRAKELGKMLVDCVEGRCQPPKCAPEDVCTADGCLLVPSKLL